MSNEALRVDSLRELSSPDTTRTVLARVLAPPALVGVAYFVGCLVGFGLRFPGSGISFFWPPTAILTATLLLASPRWWPGFLVGSLVAHGIAHSGDGISTTTWLVQFLGNGLQG